MCVLYRYSLLPCLALALLGTACSEPDAPPGESINTVSNVSIVSYLEQEAGTGTYPVRILVSEAFVRFDDGYDESDFVLLDRHSRMLFSVIHENQSVLEISNQPFDGAPPEGLLMTEERTIDEDAPLISGKQAVHFRFLAAGETCYQAITVAGLMGKAVDGMADYASALGERQLANMESVPDTMQTPCFLSRYVYAPGRHYEHGLPVTVWDENGFSSSLTDFRESETVAAALFTVPDEYERLRMGP
jgi:hypothetical protein